MFVAQKTDGMFPVTPRIGWNQKFLIKVIQCPIIGLAIALVDDGYNKFGYYFYHRENSFLEEKD